MGGTGDYRKANGLLRYSMRLGEGQIAITGMAYSGTWTSTDQVAQRAIDSGLIGRYGWLNDKEQKRRQVGARPGLSVDYAVPLAGGQFPILFV